LVITYLEQSVYIHFIIRTIQKKGKKKKFFLEVSNKYILYITIYLYTRAHIFIFIWDITKGFLLNKI